MEEQTKSMKTVYTIVDRGGGKSFWVRVGVGFTNRDGSLNLRLDAIPVNATLHVRDWEPYEKRGDAGDPQARTRPAKTREAPRFPPASSEASAQDSLP
jgi:hypothetical protein